MKDDPARNAAVLGDGRADLTDRLQAAARLLFDWHTLGRSRFLVVYHTLSGTPEALLTRAAEVLLCFAEGMRHQAARRPVAPAPEAPSAPLAASPAKPPRKAAAKTATPSRTAAAGGKGPIRQQVLQLDPDAADFKPLPGRGDSGYRFVCPDPQKPGAYKAQVFWSDFQFFKHGFSTPLDAHKAALRAARAFLQGGRS